VLFSGGFFNTAGTGNRDLPGTSGLKIAEGRSPSLAKPYRSPRPVAIAGQGERARDRKIAAGEKNAAARATPKHGLEM
jgi:hypothetical protein